MGNLLKEIRGVFASLKTTIFLLFTIAFASTIGTFIPQQREASDYVARYGERLFRLFDLFGVLNLFGSWWFQLFLVLLMTNLVVCSFSRLPRIWRGGNVTTREKVGRLGPHLTHFSLVVILAGSMIGNIWGFKGFVNIPQGESIKAVVLQGSGKMLDLDFTVRCDKFEVSTYPGSQIPKEYLSELTVLERGQEILKKTIEVNDPLRYKGISFYQSSYGFMSPRPGESKAELEIIPKGNGRKGYRLQMGVGEIKPIPGTDQKVQLTALIPDFALGEGNRPVSRSDQPNNPAIQVKIYKGGTLSFKGWSFLKFPDFHAARHDAFSVRFIDYSGGRAYTGLMVVKDPGVWVVWTGFGILVFGLYLSLHFRRRSSVHEKSKGKGETDD